MKTTDSKEHDEERDKYAASKDILRRLNQTQLDMDLKRSYGSSHFKGLKMESANKTANRDRKKLRDLSLKFNHTKDDPLLIIDKNVSAHRHRFIQTRNTGFAEQQYTNGSGGPGASLVNGQ